MLIAHANCESRMQEFRDVEQQPIADIRELERQRYPLAARRRPVHACTVQMDQRRADLVNAPMRECYDRSQPLVIYPLLQATYLGGAGEDRAFAMDIQNGGSVLLAGLTTRATSAAPRAAHSLQAARRGYR